MGEKLFSTSMDLHPGDRRESTCINNQRTGATTYCAEDGRILRETWTNGELNLVSEDTYVSSQQEIGRDAWGFVEMGSSSRGL